MTVRPSRSRSASVLWITVWGALCLLAFLAPPFVSARTPQPTAPVNDFNLAPALPDPLLSTPAPEESPTPPAVRPRYFRIGYLRSSGEDALGEDWYHTLKAALLGDAVFAKALKQAEMADVALRPCDSPEDMLQRMEQGEFDLVFAPAMVYVQHRIASPVVYRVILQTQRRDADQGDSRGGGYVRRRGVLFVRRGSQIDKSLGDSPSPDVLKRAMEGETVAVSGSYDAAGFFYVRKMLWDDYDHGTLSDCLFCGSPVEAIKSVVSGLTDVGACDEAVLGDVFDPLPVNAESDLELGKEEIFIRRIRTTIWIPTDPVLIEERFDPLGRRSSLGLAARRILRDFYDASPTAPALVEGNDTAYDAMQRDVELSQGVPW
jgi:ABC-type phosphate/phosphonate transport system substrate-binding protein